MAQMQAIDKGSDEFESLYRRSHVATLGWLLRDPHANPAPLVHREWG